MKIKDKQRHRHCIISNEKGIIAILNYSFRKAGVGTSLPEDLVKQQHIINIQRMNTELADSARLVDKLAKSHQKDNRGLMTFSMLPRELTSWKHKALIYN